MNSIHRIGLTIAGVAEALTIAGALAVQGFATSLVAAQGQPAAAAQATADPTTGPTALDPQTIYVNPAPTPRIVTVIHTPKPTRRPVVPSVPNQGWGDDGGGNDGGGD